jgi:hypothetical protein
MLMNRYHQILFSLFSPYFNDSKYLLISDCKTAFLPGDTLILFIFPRLINSNNVCLETVSISAASFIFNALSFIIKPCFWLNTV